MTEVFLNVCSLHVTNVHSLTQKFEFYLTIQNPHNSCESKNTLLKYILLSLASVCAVMHVYDAQITRD